MTLTDPIGDMFSRIRNGQMRSLHSVDMPSSNFRRKILDILKNEGFIKDYFIEKSENNKISLRINLKYYEGNPVIKENPIRPSKASKVEIRFAHNPFGAIPP